MKFWERKSKTRKREFGDFEKVQTWWEIRITVVGENGLKHGPIENSPIQWYPVLTAEPFLFKTVQIET
jgi:hypothetical protein